ncbi:MAG TPA: dihydroorotate dehydrogenase electron transfer subunit [Sedimentibacter sp.]|mgnify:FL=1|jgi:dihydroorotate dehydrogenase electron transfer subunit|nr:dihydroorotate dehydrogenase electron transfer subunit [Sedimentibacter sp.]HOK49478.1 dihydroorotate dehydrogenase electron transfer subunit [Sedimentibacter sp.]HOW22892.1 dihydroorotate dehydrogenase electron transfer subunit [Sedimentibacter sp.]HRC80755.1 dihydroorotate dehydrogenase electron transfer subunit [Sedimentibacter sp.]
MKVITTPVVKNQEISKNIRRLSVEFDSVIKPGQFFMLKTTDDAFLLPRPLSVNDVNDNIVSFLYRIEGKGTKRISSLKENDKIQVFGPLGKGFDLENLKGKTAVIGGGIGIAPLLYLCKVLGKKADVYLGYKDSENMYIFDEFKSFTDRCIIVTEDGSFGEKGFVTDYVDYEKYDAIAACGPEAMMNKLVSVCKAKNIKCYLSLERRMACGMGACLGCTVETKAGNKRACKDGPVFDSEELV